MRVYSSPEFQLQSRLIAERDRHAGLHEELRAEISVRFHHRLVAIHAFPSGTGRHGRIAADYLVTSLKGEPFSWDACLDADTDGLRTTYLHALRRADDGEIAELLIFARA